MEWKFPTIIHIGIKFVGVGDVRNKLKTIITLEVTQSAVFKLEKHSLERERERESVVRFDLVWIYG